jgi:hypothetical protein
MTPEHAKPSAPPAGAIGREVAVVRPPLMDAPPPVSSDGRLTAPWWAQEPERLARPAAGAGRVVRAGVAGRARLDRLVSGRRPCRRVLDHSRASGTWGACGAARYRPAGRPRALAQPRRRWRVHFSVADVMACSTSFAAGDTGWSLKRCRDVDPCPSGCQRVLGHCEHGGGAGTWESISSPMLEAPESPPSGAPNGRLPKRARSIALRERSSQQRAFATARVEVRGHVSEQQPVTCIVAGSARPRRRVGRTL